jgi:hypothetical protein
MGLSQVGAGNPCGGMTRVERCKITELLLRNVADRVGSGKETPLGYRLGRTLAVNVVQVALWV